jgi:PAS domain S-box-containing protein
VKDLQHKRVAVENAYVMQKKLQEGFPEISLLVVETTLEALQALSVGKVDAYVGDLEVATYLLQTNGLSNLKVAAPTHFDNHNQAMAIRKDWAPLAAIIDKALDDMTPGERQTLKNPWLAVRYEYGLSWLDVLRWGGVALLLFLSVVAIIVWKNRELASEVRQRMQMEDILREEKLRLDLAMNAARAGTWSWNLRTGHMDWDERMHRIFELQPGSFAGTYDAWAAYLHPDDAEAAQNAIDQALQHTKHYQHEYRIGVESGWRTVNVQAVTVKDHNDQPLRMVGICMDVSERKQAEAEQERLQRERRQAHKMEALGQLTGGIAHDFNNILGIVLGYTGLTLQRYGALLPDKSIDYLKEVETAGNRAKDLVAQMLAFSRGDKAEDAPLLLSPLIKEDIKMLRATLPSSMEIVTEIHPDLPTVLINPVQLNQVLMNLCLNAKDAMEGVGKLGITLSLIEGLDAECSACHRHIQGNWVELAVADDGCGMSPEVLERLFEPFFTTKAVGEGSGMGAAVVHGIVNSHGGHILVETKMGKGTRFRVLFLPMDDVVEIKTANSKTPQIASAPEHHHLLVVDDEPSVADYIHDLLELKGYQVTALTDSRAALRLMQDKPAAIDLVITDQTMPGFTGIELIRRLREIRPRLPVILCTGYSETINADDARDLAIGFLEKPIDADKLVHTVVEKLNKPALQE